MDWKSHLRIAAWVGSELKLSPENLAALTKRAVMPDKGAGWIAHQEPKILARKIRESVVKARSLFLKGDQRCYFEIGRVIHYLGDRLVPTEPEHVKINVAQELEKITARKKEEQQLAWKDKKTPQEIFRKAINSLGINEQEKTLLLDPGYIRGKQHTLMLALLTLPPATDRRSAYNVVSRASIGVAKSIISPEPPLLLLQEKMKTAQNNVVRARKKFGIYAGVGFLIPSFFLHYGNTGGIIWLSSVTLNIILQFPLFRILIKKNSQNSVQNYLALQDMAKTAAMFFGLWVLVSFLKSFWWGGVIFAVLVAYHLIYPRVFIDEEVRKEIDWYE